MAIDPGMVRCGLAISDPSASFALPLRTITLKTSDPRQAAYQILQVLEQELVETIVVGIPLLLSGKDSRMTAWARVLYQELCAALQKNSVQVVPWDERLSSRQADVLLEERQLKKKRRKEVQDSVAATLILQSYLDARHHQQQSLPLRG
ncbi:Holliday junction resolvase RuvX [Candidatus Similichlamydia laticola]|uniref:Holliday junction resolvase RuvX n=1 Tax=Candidatus Similichlamydia laticola TaxID=2170265 RepID=UPI0011C02D6B|nr:Holliday junction resolvase RuvX [Candidatus Similichlamydia laticola]